MRRRGLTVVAALVAVLALALLVRPGRRHHVLRADPTLTPGALNPDVTQATIGSTICTAGWTRTIRPPADYTHGIKVQQMRQYGESGDTGAYEEDHFISLELGGAPRDPRNLWPEPQPRARAVDRIENELNQAVCSGQLTLREAQEREAALKYRDG